MSHYVDGFVLPVPRANVDAYRQIAEAAGKVWKEHGALQFWECVGDDVSSPPSRKLCSSRTTRSWCSRSSCMHRAKSGTA